jgi:hypothetical protein
MWLTLAATFAADAAAANRAPVISGNPDTAVPAGERYSFRPSARDADGDRLTFSIANKPHWASFDASTGRLSGTPGTGAAGTYPDIRIRVSDGKASDVLGPFSIAVRGGNRAPRISGTPPGAATVGEAYAFRPSASDPDGHALTFSIANKPPWASFSTSTGRLAGTPPAKAAGEYVGIRISVSDGKATSALAPFSIAVAQANRPPVVKGAAATVVLVGSPYEFKPSATDPDGDSLRFSIANKPAWATFDPVTGRLAGTPGIAAAGSYANITIRVTDGIATVALPAFSIAVQQVANGSATLSWLPPTQRVDGSALTNLAGYRIRYGTSPDRLVSAIDIPQPGITSAVIDNLPPAKYYFVMSAYDADGNESANTPAVAKTIA